MFERLLFLCEKYPIDFISHLSSSLPIFTGILRFKYLSLTSKFILSLFTFFFVKDTIALWLSLKSLNNLYIQNIEVCVEIILTGLIFLYSFKKKNYTKVTVILTLICFVVVVIFYKGDSVSSVSLAVFRAFSIALSMLYFHRLLVDMQVRSITKHSMFWFTSGLLVYATGTFFSSLFIGYWYQSVDKVSAEVFDKYWNTGQILFVIFCLFSAYGLWVSKCDQENSI